MASEINVREKSFALVEFFLQVETEYGKGAWSGNIYGDVVAFPGDGEKINNISK